MHSWRSSPLYPIIYFSDILICIILLIADSPPGTLRPAFSEGKQKITLLQTDNPQFSRNFKNSIEDPSLEIVVIECTLDDHAGLSHLDEIKKRRTDVPIVYISASGSDHAVNDALRLGARDCFRRPVDLLRFKDRISALLRLKSFTRERRTPLLHAETCSPVLARATTDLPDTILRAVNFIEKHFYEHDLSIDRLAGIAGMSSFHFCRIFKKHMTVTPMQFVALVRVEKAKNLIRNSHENTSISVIATTTGFYDASNFNKHFKKITGLTPTGFKRSARSVNVR